jgi:hypothetical protein
MLGVARAVVADLQRDPALLPSLQLKYCCTDTHDSWPEGREPEGLTRALQETQIGALHPEPVPVDSDFYVFERLEPEPPRAEPLLYDLPNPEAPDLEWVVQNARSEALSALTLELRDAVLQRLSFNASKKSALQNRMTTMASAFANTAPGEAARLATYQNGMAEVRQMLGAADYAQYIDFVNHWSSDEVLARSH